MIEFKIKGCSVDIHATAQQKNDTGLRVVPCEYSRSAVLMDGNRPLLTVTKEDLRALYEMLAYDKSDKVVSDMIKVISDYLDSH